MRNRTLHDTLRAFAEESALQLAADATGGAEVPFEVVESPGARTPLYCYRPLTGQFIRDRLGELSRLPTYVPARRGLEQLGGLESYLRVRGEPRVPEDAGERADAALRSFLSAVWADATEFEFSSARFGRAYRELEAAVYEARSLAAVMVPLHGLELVSEQLPLDEGLSLVRGDTLDGAPAEAVWAKPVESSAPNVLAVLTLEAAPGDAPPLDQARERFRRLLTALRLVDAAGFALGASAWARADAGAWQLVPLGIGGGCPRGPGYRIQPEEEDELRGFCNLIARRLPESARAPGAPTGLGGEVAWALERFEMACERDPFVGLTDHLLALRALLEPEGAHSGRLAQRLAAICAVPEEREALAERVAHAISLERGIVAGLAPAATDAEELVHDVAHHLRALLRDVLCGHLDADLVRVAEGLLAEEGPEPAPAPAAPPPAEPEPAADPPTLFAATEAPAALADEPMPAPEDEPTDAWEILPFA
jgi:hypothetical protein